MIIEDMDAQMHIWVRCTRDQTLDDGRAVHEGFRYFALFSTCHYDTGPCTDPDHPDCEAGALEIAALCDREVRELFCAADFEPVGEEEAAELMASMIREPFAAEKIDTTSISAPDATDHRRSLGSNPDGSFSYEENIPCPPGAGLEALL